MPKKFYPNTTVENIPDALSQALAPGHVRPEDETQVDYSYTMPDLGILSRIIAGLEPGPRDAYKDINTMVPAAGVMAASLAAPYAMPSMLAGGAGMNAAMQNALNSEAMASAGAGVISTYNDLQNYMPEVDRSPSDPYFAETQAGTPYEKGSAISPFTTGAPGLAITDDVYENQIKAMRKMWMDDMLKMNLIEMMSRKGPRSRRRGRKAMNRTKHQQKMLRDYLKLSPGQAGT